MKNFCRRLRQSLSERFDIYVDVYVSKKKKLVHMSLVKPLLSWYFFEDIIKFVKEYWNKRKCFYPGYFIDYPRLNQSLKWRCDYVIIVKTKHKNITDNLLDRFYEALELFMKRKFDTYGYTVKYLK